MDRSELKRIQSEIAGLTKHCPFPQGIRTSAHEFTAKILASMFPHHAEDGCRPSLEECAELLSDITASIEPISNNTLPDLSSFWSDLPALVKQLHQDAEAMHYGDPASHSVDEVILAYPGFLAVAVYRLAHRLDQMGLEILPRLMTEDAHQRTGIDIHPHATIGHSFCIDHGTGIVIGETSVVGNGVKIYQGVTLGASAVDRMMVGTRRHPTIEDHVVIYANATILGGDTVIGHDSIIGGSAWITRSVPPFAVVGRDSEARQRPNKESELEFYL